MNDIIHEIDPWFNYRATKVLAEKGFYRRAVSFNLLHALSLPVNIRNIRVMLAPGFSALTVWSTYIFTKEMKDESDSLLAAVFIGIAPGCILHSVAGSYDNEAIAIFFLMFTFFLWIKALKQGSAFFGTGAALFYFYMVSIWSHWESSAFFSSSFRGSRPLVHLLKAVPGIASRVCRCIQCNGSIWQNRVMGAAGNVVQDVAVLITAAFRLWRSPIFCVTLPMCSPCDGQHSHVFGAMSSGHYHQNSARTSAFHSLPLPPPPPASGLSAVGSSLHAGASTTIPAKRAHRSRSGRSDELNGGWEDQALAHAKAMHRQTHKLIIYVIRCPSVVSGSPGAVAAPISTGWYESRRGGVVRHDEHESMMREAMGRDFGHVDARELVCDKKERERRGHKYLHAYPSHHAHLTLRLHHTSPTCYGRWTLIMRLDHSRDWYYGKTIVHSLSCTPPRHFHPNFALLKSSWSARIRSQTSDNVSRS
ncbi:hypothetical protein M0805_002799 [Coniferiporia weirii]|nr:hypothetical protein M0805_002799 [Coniferiporia weirii]